MFGVNREPDENSLAEARERMVESQIKRRGVLDSATLDAMQSVPRHLFMPENLWPEAYSDHALPIDCGQTISQPYIVASMTEELSLSSDSRVLEIGTGSGYQTAVLAEIAREVCTVECIQQLAEEARMKLTGMGYDNIRFRIGDGNLGWPEEAPFDGIIVTAAAMRTPPALVEQLKIGGRMIIPIESRYTGTQDLITMVKTEKGLDRKNLYAVRFVPLVGSNKD